MIIVPILTEDSRNNIRHIDQAVTGLGPHAASGSAWISVPLGFRGIGNVILQIWITRTADWHRKTQEHST